MIHANELSEAFMTSVIRTLMKEYGAAQKKVHALAAAIEAFGGELIHSGKNSTRTKRRKKAIPRFTQKNIIQKRRKKKSAR